MTRTKTRALANWPNNAVSVLDYGADPTGVTSSSSAFQAALNAADAVYVPAGTFYMAGTIQFTKDGQTLFGSGNSSIIKTASDSVYIDCKGFNQLTIKSFKLDGKGDEGGGVTNGGIRITGSGGQIRDIYFDGGQQRCWFYTADHWLVEGCTFDGTGYGVIQQNSYISSYVTVNNCIARNMSSDFVELNQAAPKDGEVSRNWIVSNCQYTGNKSYFIEGGREDRFFGSTAVENIIITGNQIQNAGGDAAIHCEAAGGETIISNNILFNNRARDGNSGIIYLLNSSEDTIVSGNIFIQDDFETLGDVRLNAIALNSNTYTNSVNFTGNRVVARNGCMFGGLVLSFQNDCSLNITGNDFEGLQSVIAGSATKNVNFTGNSTLNCESVIAQNNSGNNQDWIISNNLFAGTVSDWDISVTETNGTFGIERWKISGNTFHKGLKIQGSGNPGGNGENRGVLVSDNQFFNGATISSSRENQFYQINNQFYESSDRSGALVTSPSHINVGSLWTNGFVIGQRTALKGSVEIDIDNLNTGGNNYNRYSILLSYNGCTSSGSSTFEVLTMISLNQKSDRLADGRAVNDIVGTSNVTTAMISPTNLKITITTPSEDTIGNYTVAVMGPGRKSKDGSDGTKFTFNLI